MLLCPETFAGVAPRLSELGVRLLLAQGEGGGDGAREGEGRGAAFFLFLQLLGRVAKRGRGSLFSLPNVIWPAHSNTPPTRQQRTKPRTTRHLLQPENTKTDGVWRRIKRVFLRASPDAAGGAGAGGADAAAGSGHSALAARRSLAGTSIGGSAVLGGRASSGGGWLRGLVGARASGAPVGARGSGGAADAEAPPAKPGGSAAAHHAAPAAADGGGAAAAAAHAPGGDSEHVPMVIDMGAHWLDGLQPLSQVNNPGALMGLRLTQVVPRALAPRAAKAPPLKTLREVYPSYFEAPAAAEALLPDGMAFRT